MRAGATKRDPYPSLFTRKSAMFYRPKDQDHGLPHNPFKALVSPRPIGWISSLDAEGRANLSPYSFFNAMSDAPPFLVIGSSGVKAPPENLKDSLSNILATREFVVNIAPAALAEQMNQSSAPYPAGVDEFEMAGLEKAPCHEIAAPRVAASPASFECRLHQAIELPCWNPASRQDLIIGEVVGVHIDDAVIRDGLVDVTLYQPLARLGYMDYAKVESVFQMQRPRLG